MVAVAQLDGGLVDDRHQVVLTETGVEAKDVAGIGLLDRELGDRPSLGVVGRQQARSCVATQDGRQLPGQVVGIVHAAVAAEAAGRGHHVRCVAGEEDPPLPQPLGPVRHRAPALDVLDLHLDVRIAQRLPHVLDAALLAHVLAGARAADAVFVDGRVDDEEPGVALQREPEEARQARVEDVDDAQVAVADQRADVGAKVDRDAVGEAAVALRADAEALAHRALGAVGGDHVARAHRTLARAAPIAQVHGHAVVVLLELDRLAGVFEPRAARLGMPAENGLEADLRHEQAWCGAQVLDAFVDRAEVPGELLAAERLDRDDRAVLDELGGGRGLDLRLQAERPEQLDRALADERRTRVDRRSRVTLDDQRRDALRREEHGGREADQTAPDDDDRDVGFRHLAAHASIVAADRAGVWILTGPG